MLESTPVDHLRGVRFTASRPQVGSELEVRGHLADPERWTWRPTSGGDTNPFRELAKRQLRRPGKLVRRTGFLVERLVIEGLLVGGPAGLWPWLSLRQFGRGEP